MLRFLRERKARKAAVVAIAPLVERSRRRFDSIPDAVWLDPYMIGFVGYLITSVALRDGGPLGSESMGLVQSEAWAEITGLSADLVGEEICLLSSAGDGAFNAGCRNAAALFSLMQARPRDAADLALGNPATALDDAAATRSDNVEALWSAFFERHVCEAGRLLPKG